MKNVRVCHSTLLMLLLTGTAHAADIGSCIGIDEPTARLACYDAAAGRGATPVTQSAAARSVPATDEFGMNERLKREKDGESARDTGPQSQVATISDAQRNSQGYFTLTLDNGQRWYVSEVLQPQWFKAGEQVTIRRGSFGSFLLTRARGGQVSRARRIE